MYNMYYIHKKMTLFSKWSIFCPFSKPSTVQSEINTILLWLEIYLWLIIIVIIIVIERYWEIDRLIDTDIDACIYRYRYADTYIDRQIKEHTYHI